MRDRVSVVSNEVTDCYRLAAANFVEHVDPAGPAATQVRCDRAVPKPIRPARPSDLGLFGNFQGVVDLNTEVAHRRFKFGMAEQQLNGTQILRTSVHQGRLRPSHGVGSVIRRVKAELLDPALEDPGVLAGPQVGRFMKSTREQEVVRLQSRLLDPPLHGIAGGRRDLELNRALRLVLHHHRARGHLLAVANVPDLERYEVTTLAGVNYLVRRPT